MNRRRQKIHIADLGRVVTGKTPPTKQQELYGTSYPFITPTDIGEDSRYIETARHISEQGRRRHSSMMLPPNTVCFTCIASIGKICMTSQLSLTNQQINSIIPEQTKNDPKYIFYLLRAEAERIKAIASGVATPIINKTMFSEIEIEVFPISTQRKIAAILSAYDDLIENNLRRIKILEEMAQNLYREWFVKFRFPGHEKARFVDSPLGRIPEGWEVVKVGEILSKTKRGFKIQKQNYTSEGFIPVIDQGKEFIGGYTNNKESLISDNLPLIVFGDHTRVLKFIDFPFACGADGTQLLKSNTERMPMTLFYYALLAIDLSDFAYARHFKFLKEESFVLPVKSIADLFDQFVSPMRDQLRSLMQKNTILRRTRDLLLPKLISGEVDVSQLDITIPEEVA
jgi:type I restriction enzyme S subunit